MNRTADAKVLRRLGLAICAATVAVTALAGCAADAQDDVGAGGSSTPSSSASAPQSSEKSTLTIAFTNNSQQTLTYAEDTMATVSSGTIVDPPAPGSIVLHPGDQMQLELQFSYLTNRIGIVFGPKFTYTDSRGTQNSVVVSAEMDLDTGNNTIACTPAAGDESVVNLVANEVQTGTCDISAHGVVATSTVTWVESSSWSSATPTP